MPKLRPVSGDSRQDDQAYSCWRTSDLCSMFNIDPRTLKESDCPRVKLKRRLLWPKAEVRAWMLSKMEESTQ